MCTELLQDIAFQGQQLSFRGGRAALGLDQGSGFLDGGGAIAQLLRQAAIEPRNVTIGFYGPLSIREGTDPAWIEAAEQAYRSDEAAARQQRAIPLADGEDYGDEFADEEVPF